MIETWVVKEGLHKAASLTQHEADAPYGHVVESELGAGMLSVYPVTDISISEI